MVRRRTAAARFRMVRKLPPRPLPGDQLPAPVRRQLRLPRPARGPLRAPGARALGGPHRRAGHGPARPRLHDDAARAARALPAGRAHPRGAALSARPRRRQLVGADRQLGPRCTGSRRTASYVSASLVKAMLLTSYLRGIGNRMPDAAERALLGPMITVSSNDAADTIYYRVGDAALYRLAKARGHDAASPSPATGRNAHFSAEDQARFFNRIDRLIPRRSRAYARGLLSSIVSYQRWGFSRYAGAAGFRTFFKGGWRGTGAGQLVHEAALFERGRTRRLDGRAHRRQPVTRVRHRDAPRSGAADLPRPPRRSTAAGGRGPERGRHARRPAAPASWTCTATRPGIRVNLSYRTKHNETGAPLPGYCENWALMHDWAAFSLGQVQRYLRRRGLGLLILDAYRPVRATRGARPLGGAHRPRRRRGHLHRAPQPPQHRQRGGHHARAPPRRQAPQDGRLRVRPELAHLQRARPDPAQPARCSRARWSASASPPT